MNVKMIRNLSEKFSGIKKQLGNDWYKKRDKQYERGKNGVYDLPEYEPEILPEQVRKDLFPTNETSKITDKKNKQNEAKKPIKLNHLKDLLEEDEKWNHPYKQFETDMVYEAFKAKGKWDKYPGAIFFRFDLRNIDEVNVIESKFKISGQVIIYFAKELGNVPKIQTRNATEGEDMLGKRCKFSEHKGQLSYAGKLQCEEFNETMELANFPFDVQYLSMFYSLSGFYTENDLQTEKDEDHNEKLKAIYAQKNKVFEPELFLIPLPGRLNVSSEMNEWYLMPPKIEVSYQKETGRSQSKPMLKISLIIARKWQHFFYNYILVGGAVTSLNFCVFVFTPDNFSDRAEITFALILTNVAFKFILITLIPATSYLTLLDKYLMLCIFLCTTLLVEGGIMAAMESGGYNMTTIDHIAGLILGSIWIGIHFLLGIKLNAYMNLIRQKYGYPIKQKGYMQPDSDAEEEQKFWSSRIKLPWFSNRNEEKKVVPDEENHLLNNT